MKYPETQHSESLVGLWGVTPMTCTNTQHVCEETTNSNLK